ncbi:MAG: hypothetical protein V4692_01370, partial [Bdellovibrionota bacterium]
KKYIKSLLEQAAKKVDTEYESPVSHFVGYTFTASDDALRRLRLELKSVMEKYMSEATPADHGIQIAQASFQIYPVVKADA